MTDIKELVEHLRLQSAYLADNAGRGITDDDRDSMIVAFHRAADALERFVRRTPFLTNCDLYVRPGDSGLFDAETGQAFLDGYVIRPREADALPRMQWISVEHEPQKDADYLVLRKSGVICVDFYDAGSGWFSAGERVTHWMPLPKPPC